jgi:hypothetical protein
MGSRAEIRRPCQQEGNRAQKQKKIFHILKSFRLNILKELQNSIG